MNWIKRTEKTPENETIVLVTVEDGTITDAGIAIGRQVLTAFYDEDGSFQAIGYGNVCLDEDVVAWSPMPEPYDEEAENE